MVSKQELFATISSQEEELQLAILSQQAYYAAVSQDEISAERLIAYHQAQAEDNFGAYACYLSPFDI